MASHSTQPDKPGIIFGASRGGEHGILQGAPIRLADMFPDQLTRLFDIKFCGDLHLPLKAGFRFSEKALRASKRSSVPRMTS